MLRGREERVAFAWDGILSPGPADKKAACFAPSRLDALLFPGRAQGAAVSFLCVQVALQLITVLPGGDPHHLIEHP